ncbi:hypothetical protein L6164_027794 [Bauhinia variegata]|uniref:Uncharacterized protein n=1 Tax=Bauhinia variegata TaxID=167791 RepID=A0ACB9LUD9_BAUVA|nr:hypothetical protein L6164_027794 [Bauhinia variegata]
MSKSVRFSCLIIFAGGRAIRLPPQSGSSGFQRFMSSEKVIMNRIPRGCLLDEQSWEFVCLGLDLKLGFNQDELFGMAEDPDGDPVFKKENLNMDEIHRTGETKRVQLSIVDGFVQFYTRFLLPRSNFGQRPVGYTSTPRVYMNSNEVEFGWMSRNLTFTELEGMAFLGLRMGKELMTIIVTFQNRIPIKNFVRIKFVVDNSGVSLLLLLTIWRTLLMNTNTPVLLYAVRALVPVGLPLMSRTLSAPQLSSNSD